MRLRLQTNLLLAAWIAQAAQMGAFAISLIGVATLPGATELNPWGLHPTTFYVSSTLITCIVIGMFYVGRKFPHPLMGKMLLSFPVAFAVADFANDLVAYVLKDSYVAIVFAIVVAASVPTLVVMWELDPNRPRSLKALLRRRKAE